LTVLTVIAIGVGVYFAVKAYNEGSY